MRVPGGDPRDVAAHPAPAGGLRLRRSGRPGPGVCAVAASGSALPGDLATAWMDRLPATRSTTRTAPPRWPTRPLPRPVDLRAAPSSAGKAATRHGRGGSSMREGRPGLPKPARRGEGVIPRSANSLLFEGLHRGRWQGDHRGPDVHGRRRPLRRRWTPYVEGRDDEMIVSGGEYVFPLEVESCLASPPTGGRGGCDRRASSRFRSAARGVRRDAPGRAQARPSSGSGSGHGSLVTRSHASWSTSRSRPRNATGKVLKRELK